LDKELQRNGITTAFKCKGNTNEVQGVRFEKNGYIFNGSEINRQFSYSKIDYQLQQNDRAQEMSINQFHQDYSQDQAERQGRVTYNADEADKLQERKERVRDAK
jgi:hypothetical protein